MGQNYDDDKIDDLLDRLSRKLSENVTKIVRAFIQQVDDVYERSKGVPKDREVVLKAFLEGIEEGMEQSFEAQAKAMKDAIDSDGFKKVLNNIETGKVN